jgi:indolepyruvate decarboxylase
MAADPKKRVIAITGDGAFQMTGMELSTAAQNGMAPIVIVLKNDGSGTQPLILAGVMNPNDVWVVQRGRGSHLASEALAELLVLAQCRVQHLQRVDPVERDVCHAIDQPHAAAADQLVDPITPDYSAPLQFIASDWHR